MFYKLNEGLKLRGWKKAPYALVDLEKNYTHFINAREMQTLQMCNGKLVTDSLLCELDKRGIHPEFNMSYDGVEGWHDWLRGVDGATESVENAFVCCRDKGFPTGAEMCIHNGNKHLLRDTVTRLASLGCRSLKVIPISNTGACTLFKGGWTDRIIEKMKQIGPELY